MVSRQWRFGQKFASSKHTMERRAEFVAYLIILSAIITFAKLVLSTQVSHLTAKTIASNFGRGIQGDSQIQ